MDNLLDRYKAQAPRGRRLAVDPELIQRWEWDARYNGDKNIKVEIAKARRTATALDKAISQFCNLKAAHEQSIKGAAVAMRELASGLEALAVWARDYHAFCLAEWRRIEVEEADSFAAARWPSAAAMEFERAIIAELSTSEGQLAFAAWCHSNNRHTDCALAEVSPPIDCLQRASTPREAMVRTVHRGMEHRMHNKWRGVRGMTVICSWTDYEDYLAYRRGVATAAAELLQSVGGEASDR